MGTEYRSGLRICQLQSTWTTPKSFKELTSRAVTRGVLVPTSLGICAGAIEDLAEQLVGIVDEDVRLCMLFLELIGQCRHVAVPS